MNEGLKNMDELLKKLLDNYQAEPSPQFWGRMKTKLFKKDVSDFASFKKLHQSFHSNQTLSYKVKIITSYAAAACLVVGVVFGATYTVYNNFFRYEVKESPLPANTGNNPTASVIDSAETKQDTSTRIEVQSDNYISKQTNETISIITETDNTIPFHNSVETIAESKIEKDYQNTHQTLVNYIQKQEPDKKEIAKTNNDLPEEQIQQIIAEIDANKPEQSLDFEEENITYKIVIPNVFTPNNDGYNDKFVILNIDRYPDNYLLVADRSGRTVYERQGYDNDWDASRIEAGTYYYILSYTEKNKSKNTIKGMVTILK